MKKKHPETYAEMERILLVSIQYSMQAEIQKSGIKIE
jgi:hypothetical protein